MPTTLAPLTLAPLTAAEQQSLLPPLPPVQNPSSEPREVTALRIARELAAQKPTWIVFFCEVLGVSGIIRRLYPIERERLRFQRCQEFAQIQTLLDELRRRSPHDDSGVECQRVITLRIPKSLHEALKRDAADLGTSLNQLGITRLLKLQEELVS